MSLAKILIVDDEPGYLEGLRLNLEAAGYDVMTASSGPEALSSLNARPQDLVLLDLRMPEMDGFEVLERLRQSSDVPVIIVTALGAEKDIVRGLQLGADDYVTKPFGIGELEARISSTLRRARPRAPDALIEDYADEVLRTDLAHRRVFVHGRAVRLTFAESLLLRELVRHPDRVLSPDYLWQVVWGRQTGTRDNVIRVTIHRLRQRLEPDPSSPRYIHSERGIGYYFARKPATPEAVS